MHELSFISRLTTLKLRRAHIVFLWFTVWSTSSALGAEQNGEIRITAPIRYDYRYDFDTQMVARDRLQYQLGILFLTPSINSTTLGSLNIGGQFGTGESYTSPWNTAVNYADPNARPQEFNLRQFYGRWTLDRWQIHLGIIPPVKGKVSETSLDKDGWIRGGRIIMPLPISGQLEFVAGALDHLDDPSAFQNWNPPNYFETEWTQAWDPSLRTELGTVMLDSEVIGRIEVRCSAFMFLGIRTEVAGEVLHNFSSSSWAHDWSATHRIGSLSLSNEYAYVPSELGLLGTLSNDFFTFGHLWVLGLKRPIWSSDNVFWFVRNYLGEERINFKVGVGYTHQF